MNSLNLEDELDFNFDFIMTDSGLDIPHICPNLQI